MKSRSVQEFKFRQVRVFFFTYAFHDFETGKTNGSRPGATNEIIERNAENSTARDRVLQKTPGRDEVLRAEISLNNLIR